MMKFMASAAAGLLMTALALPALAQTDADARDEVASLRPGEGVIMLSIEQGPFNTPTQQQRVATGDRLMVAKDSAATVVYDDGCEIKYDEAGVYEIEPDCKVVGAWWGQSDAGMRTLAIAGGAVLGGVAGYHLKDCPPVSR
ncbi:MAG: hypothetical protein RBT55_09275 [Rhodocyclaceae bacterium]|jgi:hypothetical protein|nr:hypothetical protein [Rhodocyclaceae bacterium]